MYRGSLYGRTFESESITQIKRMGSTVANRYNNPVDEMVVTSENGEYVYHRFNQKYPDNVIVRGSWR